jgi:hypothetical protein
MYLVKRIMGLVFWISLTGWIYLSLVKPPLPKPDEVKPDIVGKNPVQKEIKMPPVKMTVKGFDYEITPLYEYDIYGVVVEQYTSANMLDFWHKTDPANTRDLCLVWGNTIKNGAYREVKYGHGEFTCYLEWKDEPKNPFNPYELSNNHLLPKNEDVALAVSRADIGDQVRIRGWLSKYAVSQNGKLISTRGTSTTREDMGDGACETILVGDLQILKEQLPERKLARKVMPWVVLVSFVLSVGLYFVEAEPKARAKITFD